MATTDLGWLDGVEVQRDEARGRFAVATRDISRGEAILREAPLVPPVLHPALWGERCSCCFEAQEDAALLRCSRCRLVLYCDKGCQKADWKAAHKHECAALQHPAASLRSGDGCAATRQSRLSSALLVGRVARKAAAREAVAAVLVAAPAKCAAEAVAEAADLVLEIGLGGGLPRAALLLLLRQFQANNFGVMDQLLISVGAAVFPQGAALNHSCAHNCAIAYLPRCHTQVIRAIADVRAGEELCHPYVDVAKPTARRVAQLEDTYGFACTCERCEDALAGGRWAEVDAALVAVRDDGRPPLGGCEHDFGSISDATLAALQQQGGGGGGGGDAAVAWRLVPSEAQAVALARADQLCAQAAEAADERAELALALRALGARAAVLHPLHASLAEARGHCLQSAMLAGDWAEAERQCAFIIRFYQKVYCPGHPLLGLQLFTLGNLLYQRATTARDGRFDTAVAMLNHAYDILVATHGEEHPLVHSLVEMHTDASEKHEAQCQAEGGRPQ